MAKGKTVAATLLLVSGCAHDFSSGGHMTAQGRNPNTFANNPLNRAAERRLDATWIASKLKDATTYIVPLRKLMPFVVTAPGSRKKEVGWMRPQLIGSLLQAEAITIFLGVEKDAAYFALDVTDGPDPSESGALAGLGSFADLRGIAMEIDPGDAAILAQAKSLIDWHQRHRFCANCGAPTRFADAGYKRQCNGCKAEHFPRTDPVVIMLATRGDRCLLGRGHRFPKGFYSALAGFIEPGESIEEAVLRELEEEAGIKAANVRYFSTQPWPYPSSLMIGCFAEAISEEIKVDASELAEARWFTHAEITLMLQGKLEGCYVPPPLAIAHQLIKAWAEDHA
jgi:NAD+ diphosphatase